MSEHTGSHKNSKKHPAENSILTTNSEELRPAGQVQAQKVRSVSASGEGERRKKQRSIYLICILAVSLILAGLLIFKASLTVNEQLTLQLTVNETDISDTPDAVYSGIYKSSHLSAAVNVAIEGGLMTDISLERYTGIDPVRANEVIDSVLIYQMLNVPDDDIGTQFTDKIVLKAIENALSGSHEQV